MRARVEVWLWLANALGFAPAHSNEILLMYPNMERLYDERNSVDLSLILTAGQLAILKNTEPEDFVARRDDCRAQHVEIVTYDDENYPKLLREIDSPPPILYYRGDITAANRLFTLSIVGTRKPSAYGMEATKLISRELAAEGVALVSGLAGGLDSECHKAAINVGTPTIACLAFGHDNCYPASNRTLKVLIEKQGLTLSEYPPGTGIQKQYFLQRNRLIAGLSRGLCVAEARKASGTMNTVSAALNFGRDVFSVPGSIFSALSEGTNFLLTEGAVPATCAADILTYYGMKPLEEPAGTAAAPVMKLSDNAALVHKTLLPTAQNIAEIAAKTGLPPPLVMAALTELELAGYSRQQAGRLFVIGDAR